jgi:hypothetical protein
VSEPLLSPKDEAAPRLRDVQDRLIEYRTPEPVP